MRRTKIMWIVGFVIIILNPSCLDDDMFEELKKEEPVKLKNYLEKNNIPDETINGIYFVRRDTINGPKPADNDYVLASYNMRLINNKLVETTNHQLAKANNLIPSISYSGALLIKINDHISGIYYGFRNLSEGDSALFIIPSNMAIGSGSNNLIPPYSTLLYEVRLEKIISNPIIYDSLLVQGWLKDTLLNQADTTTDGNYYKIIEAGNAESPIEPGSIVELRYRGRFADGRYFNNSTKFETFSFPVGANRVIKGFESVVKKLSNQSKAVCIIPYYNAYGAEGLYSQTWQSNIPPFTSLVYEIEITKVE